MRLILTLDYELYGNGDGDVREHIIEPTERFIRTCNAFGIKATIFFEVLEYVIIKEMYESGVSMGYGENPASLIEQQIRQLYREGHDIQLHLHPQWVGADYRQGTWHLNEKYWRLTDIPGDNDKTGIVNLRRIMMLGKNTVEKILKSVDPSYKCQILRAGSLNIVPSNDILKIMREIGLTADSSVVPGACSKNLYSDYDFRMIKNSVPYWYTQNNDILDMNSTASEGKVYEFPLFALKMRRYRKITVNRLYKKLRNKAGIKTTLSRASNSETKKSGIVENAKSLLRKEANLWDFCLLSFSEMKYFYSVARKIAASADHPFVLLGHTKEFTDSASLEKFIDYVNSRSENVEFVTLKELLYSAQNNRERRR